MPKKTSGCGTERYTNADLKISIHVCVLKQYPENVAFLILIPELFSRQILKFFKE